jgi:catechol 2,3-dioxygenase-like lactoylglutathione lyase family enzyme
VLRLDHVVVPIWHVKKSLAFYRDFLGLKLIDADEGDDWGGHRWLMMIFALSDQRQIALVYLKGAKKGPASKLPKDVRHIAMAETGAGEADQGEGRALGGRARRSPLSLFRGSQRQRSGVDGAAVDHASPGRSRSRQDRETLGQGRKVLTLDARLSSREGGWR